MNKFDELFQVKTYTQKKLNGFTITEILVALGLLSILGLAVSKSMTDSLKQQKTLTNKLNVTETRSDLNSVFKLFTNSCSCIFNNDLHSTTGTLKSLIQSESGPINLDTTNLNINYYSQEASCSAATKKPIITNSALLGQNKIFVKTLQLSKPMNLGGKKYMTDLTINLQSSESAQMILQPVVIKNILVDLSTGNFECIKTADTFASLNCPAGAVLLGFNESGQPLCSEACLNKETLVYDSATQNYTCKSVNQLLANVSCSAGQYLRGFQPDGSIICDTAATATSPPVTVSTITPTPAPPPSTPITPPAATTPPPTTATTPPGPVSGTVIGGGSCTPYTSGPCTGDCGGYASCPSTWTFWGVGKSGGCQTGYNMKSTSVNSGGVTGYVCLVP